MLLLLPSPLIHSSRSSSQPLPIKPALWFRCAALFFSNFVSRLCLHFILRFWNHTFTYIDIPAKLISHWQSIPTFLFTCASVKPRRAANFLRSGFVMYFCIWNWISNPLRCNWLNTARDQERLRFGEFWCIPPAALLGLTPIDGDDRCTPIFVSDTSMGRWWVCCKCENGIECGVISFSTP